MRARRRRAGREAAHREVRRRAERRVSRRRIHERAAEPDERNARAHRVADGRAAAAGVEARHPFLHEAHAAELFRALRDAEPPRRHLEDGGAARGIEHVRPLEKLRERSAVIAIADDVRAGLRRRVDRLPAHLPTAASERNVHARDRSTRE